MNKINLIKNFKIPIAYFHIGFWLLYLGVAFFLNTLTEKNTNILSLFLLLLPLILFFYLCLLGFGIFKLKYWKGIIYFLFLFIILFCGGYFLLTKIFPFFNVNIITKDFNIYGYLQSIIPVSIKFFSYALLYFLIREIFKIQTQLLQKENERLSIENEKNMQQLNNEVLARNKMKLQNEKLHYQYAFLQAQINPHFLYNTLNVLFSQALPLSTKLADNVMKLSDLMRYSLESSSGEDPKVSLEKELNHLKILLDIYQERFSNKLFIDFEINGEILNQKVLPLSFLTIVENAFKYGNFKDEDFPLKINLKISKENVIFSCSNKKSKNKVNVLSNNIGISNLKQRLAISFQDKFEIRIDETDEFYTLILSISQI